MPPLIPRRPFTLPQTLTNLGQAIGGITKTIEEAPLRKFRAELMGKLDRGDPLSPAEMDLLFGRGGSFSAAATQAGIDPFGGRQGGPAGPTPVSPGMAGIPGAARLPTGSLREILGQPGPMPGAPGIPGAMKAPESFPPARLGVEDTLEILRTPSPAAEEDVAMAQEDLKDRVAKLNSLHMQINMLMSFQGVTDRLPNYNVNELTFKLPFGKRTRGREARRFKQKINDLLQSAQQYLTALKMGFAMGPEMIGTVLPPEALNYLRLYPDDTKGLQQFLSVD